MIEQQPILLEVILQSKDFKFASRDEIEEPLEEALRGTGLGEVTGVGTGAGILNLDIEVYDLEAGLRLVSEVLRSLKVAESTVINQYQPSKVVHLLYEE